MKLYERIEKLENLNKDIISKYEHLNKSSINNIDTTVYFILKLGTTIVEGQNQHFDYLPSPSRDAILELCVKKHSTWYNFLEGVDFLD